jgi:hypothetical protein
VCVGINLLNARSAFALQVETLKTLWASGRTIASPLKIASGSAGNSLGETAVSAISIENLAANRLAAGPDL